MPSITRLSRKADRSGHAHDRRLPGRNHNLYSAGHGFVSDLLGKNGHQDPKRRQTMPAGLTMPTLEARDTEAEVVVGDASANIIGEPSFYRRANESVRPEADNTINPSAQNVQSSAKIGEGLTQNERNVTSQPGTSQRPQSARSVKRKKAKAPYGTQEYIEPDRKPRSKQLRRPAKPAQTKSSAVRAERQTADSIYDVEDDSPDNAGQDNDGPEEDDQEDDLGSEVVDGAGQDDEDSIPFDVPRNALLLAEVSHEKLRMLFARIDRWTYSSDGWDKALTPRQDEEKMDWLESQSQQFRLETTRKLYRQLYDLAMLCRGLPQDPDAQVPHLVAAEEALRVALNKVHASVSNLRNTILSYLPTRKGLGTWCHKARKLVMDVVKCIIPLLAVTIREAAAVGGGINGASEGWTYGTGDFTTATLPLIMHTVGWTQRIISATKKLLETRHIIFTSARKSLAEDSMTRRAVRVLEDYLVSMGDDLTAYRLIMKNAVDRLEYLADTTRRNAAAKARDQLIRAAKAEKERKHYEQIEQQHSWFIQSTQADCLARLERDWGHAEDSALLSVIRRSRRPEPAVMVQILASGRTPAEVQKRVLFLRNSSKDYFVKKGIEPPKWCYER